MSDEEEKESKVEGDLRTVEEKIEHLEENAGKTRSNVDLDKIVDLFVETCHHLAKDIRSEKEIRKEIERLEEDEKTYVQLMNRIQRQDLSEEKRQRLQSLIGRIPREEVESAIKEDKKLERKEETTSRELIQRLDEVYNGNDQHPGLYFNLKSANNRALLEDCREAWVQLTHLESAH